MIALETYALQDEIQRLYETKTYNNIKVLQKPAKSIEDDVSLKWLGLENKNLKEISDWKNYLAKVNTADNLLHKTRSIIISTYNANFLRQQYYVENSE